MTAYGVTDVTAVTVVTDYPYCFTLFDLKKRKDKSKGVNNKRVTVTSVTSVTHMAMSDFVARYGGDALSY